MESNLVYSGGSWRKRIEEARELLALKQNRLIDAETALADRLAAIHSFEFKLRSHVGQIVSRLESLEREIAGLRKLLRLKHEDWDNGDGRFSHWKMDDFDASSAGEYRYRKPAAAAPEAGLAPDNRERFKRLYRRLARRFHPDMAVNDKDRSYRTQMMMAINTAYAAHDLAKLEELELEPDPAQPLENVKTDEEMFEAINREINRCQRRLDEIQAENDRLTSHRSSKLIQQMKRIESNGKEFWVILENQLREQVSLRQVERDVLKEQLASLEVSKVSADLDDLAETVWHLGLEGVFGEDDEKTMDDILFRRQGYQEFDEDNPDMPD